VSLPPAPRHFTSNGKRTAPPLPRDSDELHDSVTTTADSGDLFALW